jgi:hypothetical protein
MRDEWLFVPLNCSMLSFVSGQRTLIAVTARHYQLNGLRQVHLFKSIRLRTRSVVHLALDLEGLNSGHTVSGSGDASERRKRIP